MEGGPDHASAMGYPQPRTITCNAQTHAREWHFLKIPLSIVDYHANRVMGEWTIIWYSLRA